MNGERGGRPSTDRLEKLAASLSHAARERQRPPAAELPATEAVAQPEISEADVREALA